MRNSIPVSNMIIRGITNLRWKLTRLIACEGRRILVLPSVHPCARIVRTNVNRPMQTSQISDLWPARGWYGGEEAENADLLSRYKLSVLLLIWIKNSRTVDRIHSLPSYAVRAFTLHRQIIAIVFPIVTPTNAAASNNPRSCSNYSL